MAERPFAAYEGVEPCVFVCYAHDDEAKVFLDIGWLHGHGIHLWYDEGIGGGTIWRAELANAIERAKLVLFFASPASIASEHCNRELNYALDCPRPILPVYLEDAQLPADLRIGLARVQAIHRHALAEETYRAKLLDSVQRTKPERTPVDARPASTRRWLAGAAALLVAIVGGWLAFDARDDGAVRSLAVLPFENLSGDPAHEYFADGFTDVLITDLSKVGGAKVISRTSVMPYKDAGKPLDEIARELGVDGVVEGSVFRDGERVRISVQLIHGATDTLLWADSYERKLENILRLQGEVALAVAQQIQIVVSPEDEARIATRRSVNPGAYEAYLKGMFFVKKLTPRGFEKGLPLLQSAIEADPADPLAYAGLALAYSLARSHSPDPLPDALARAKAAAETAIKLDDTVAAAHAAIAQISLYTDWDWPRAGAEFERALALNPNLADALAHYAWYLNLMGRHEESLAHMRRAVSVDPLAPLWTTWIGDLHLSVRHYDLAIEAGLKGRELDPDFPWASFLLGHAYAENGMFEEAIAAHEQAVAANPGWTWALARTLAVSGRLDEARHLANELELRPRRDALGMAGLSAALGDSDRAFEWLEIAYETRHPFFPWLKLPMLDPLRDDPRFAEMRERLQLPPSHWISR